MSSVTEIWSPDTCPCVVQVTYAGGSPPVVNQWFTKCVFHVGLTDIAALVAIRDENSRKNIVTYSVINNISGFANVVSGSAFVSGVNNIIASGMSIAFNYTGTAPNRVLNISTGVMTGPQITTEQTWCNTVVGSGKVVVST